MTDGPRITRRSLVAGTVIGTTGLMSRMHQIAAMPEPGRPGTRHTSGRGEHSDATGPDGHHRSGPYKCLGQLQSIHPQR